MSFTILPLSASEFAAPRDHVYLKSDDTPDFFAQAAYIVNPQDIKVSLSADNINIDLNEINTDLDTVNANLSTVIVNTSQIPGFSLPSFDSVTPAYHGSTDNFDTVSYYKNSTLIAILSFTYVVQPPTVNSERVSNITRTV